MLKKGEHDWWSVCVCVISVRPNPEDPLKQVKPLSSGFTVPFWVGGAQEKFQIKSDRKTSRELLHTRLGDTQQHRYRKCFVVESRIPDAGGSCLSLFFSRSYSTLSPSRRSPDGSRTRTQKHTTPACGRNAEAATTSLNANLSWSFVSIGFESF